jgi:hypothetical protein
VNRLRAVEDVAGLVVPSALTRGRGCGPRLSWQRQLPVGGAHGGDRWHQQYQSYSAIHGGQCRRSWAPPGARLSGACTSQGCSCLVCRQTHEHLRLGNRFGGEPAPKRNPCERSGAPASWREAGLFCGGTRQCKLPAQERSGIIGCSLTIS